MHRSHRTQSLVLRGLTRATVSAIFPVATSPHAFLARRLARSSAVALTIYVIGAGVSYCAQMLIARINGADGYGVYAYAITWMTVLAYCSALGFDVLLLRFVPAYRAQQAPDLMQGVIRYAQCTVAAVGCGAAVVGAAAIALGGGHLPRGLVNTFLIGFTLVPIWAVLWISCSIVRAFGGVVSALLPDRVGRDGLLFCVLVVAARGWGWHPDACTTMGVTVICSAVALCLVSWAGATLQARELAGVRPTYASSLWLRSAPPLVLIAIIEPLMYRTGAILLGWTGEVKNAGIYAVAFNVAFLVMLPCTAVKALFAPTSSELFASGDRAGLQSVIIRISVFTLLGALCTALPLSLFAHSILGLFGQDFDVGVPALRILLVGQVIAAALGSLRSLVLMTGHERGAALLLALSAATGGLLGVILIGRFGLTGAAVATTLTLVVWSSAMALFVWWRLRLLPGVPGIYPLTVGSSRRNEDHGLEPLAEAAAAKQNSTGT
jgi:O-antigen/teichoic acid export membrane protein